VRVEKEGINLFLRMPLALHAELLLGRRTYNRSFGPDRTFNILVERRGHCDHKSSVMHTIFLRTVRHNVPGAWIGGGGDGCGWHKCLIFQRIHGGWAADTIFSLT